MPGENTITVQYNGKTITVRKTPVAQSNDPTQMRFWDFDCTMSFNLDHFPALRNQVIQSGGGLTGDPVSGYEWLSNSAEPENQYGPAILHPNILRFFIKHQGPNRGILDALCSQGVALVSQVKPKRTFATLKPLLPDNDLFSEPGWYLKRKGSRPLSQSDDKDAAYTIALLLNHIRFEDLKAFSTESTRQAIEDVRRKDIQVQADALARDASIKQSQQLIVQFFYGNLTSSEDENSEYQLKLAELQTISRQPNNKETVDSDCFYEHWKTLPVSSNDADQTLENYQNLLREANLVGDNNEPHFENLDKIHRRQAALEAESPQHIEKQLQGVETIQKKLTEFFCPMVVGQADESYATRVRKFKEKAEQVYEKASGYGSSLTPDQAMATFQENWLQAMAIRQQSKGETLFECAYRHFRQDANTVFTMQQYKQFVLLLRLMNMCRYNVTKNSELGDKRASISNDMLQFQKTVLDRLKTSDLKEVLFDIFLLKDPYTKWCNRQPEDVSERTDEKYKSCYRPDFEKAYCDIIPEGKLTFEECTVIPEIIEFLAPITLYGGDKKRQDQKVKSIHEGIGKTLLIQHPDNEHYIWLELFAIKLNASKKSLMTAAEAFFGVSQQIVSRLFIDDEKTYGDDPEHQGLGVQFFLSAIHAAEAKEDLYHDDVLEPYVSMALAQVTPLQLAADVFCCQEVSEDNTKDIALLLRHPLFKKAISECYRFEFENEAVRAMIDGMVEELGSKVHIIQNEITSQDRDAVLVFIIRHVLDGFVENLAILGNEILQQINSALSLQKTDFSDAEKANTRLFLLLFSSVLIARQHHDLSELFDSIYNIVLNDAHQFEWVWTRLGDLPRKFGEALQTELGKDLNTLTPRAITHAQTHLVQDDSENTGRQSLREGFSNIFSMRRNLNKDTSLLNPGDMEAGTITMSSRQRQLAAREDFGVINNKSRGKSLSTYIGFRDQNSCFGELKPGFSRVEIVTLEISGGVDTLKSKISDFIQLHICLKDQGMTVDVIYGEDEKNPRLFHVYTVGAMQPPSDASVTYYSMNKNNMLQANFLFPEQPMCTIEHGTYYSGLVELKITYYVSPRSINLGFGPEKTTIPHMPVLNDFSQSLETYHSPVISTYETFRTLSENKKTTTMLQKHCRSIAWVLLNTRGVDAELALYVDNDQCALKLNRLLSYFFSYVDKPALSEANAIRYKGIESFLMMVFAGISLGAQFQFPGTLPEKEVDALLFGDFSIQQINRGLVGGINFFSVVSASYLLSKFFDWMRGKRIVKFNQDVTRQEAKMLNKALQHTAEPVIQRVNTLAHQILSEGDHNNHALLKNATEELSHMVERMRLLPGERDTPISLFELPTTYGSKNGDSSAMSAALQHLGAIARFKGWQTAQKVFLIACFLAATSYGLYEAIHGFGKLNGSEINEIDDALEKAWSKLGIFIDLAVKVVDTGLLGFFMFMFVPHMLEWLAKPNKFELPQGNFGHFFNRRAHGSEITMSLLEPGQGYNQEPSTFGALDF